MIISAKKIIELNKIMLKPGDFVLAKTIEKVNVPTKKVVIEELGARIANLVFKQVDGDVNPYKGPWQGGRVSTGNFE